MTLSTMRRTSFGFSSRNSPSRSPTTCSTHVFTCEETSLSFVCEENFGSRILTEMTAAQTFADVVALEAQLQLLQDARGLDVLVHRARQRGLEADEVRAAVEVLDRVREAVEVLGVALVPLHRDLDRLAVFFVADEDRLVVQRRLVLVQVLDERDDAALVAELVLLLGALVGDGDEDAGVEERQLAQTLRKRLEVHLRDGEDRRVGFERDARAALRASSRRGRSAPSERRAS